MIKVTTEYPIYLNNRMVANYSNGDGSPYDVPGPPPSGPLPGLGGAGYTPPSTTSNATAKSTKGSKLKNFGSKVGGFFNKAKNSGVLANVANALLTPSNTAPAPPAPTTSSGTSSGGHSAGIHGKSSGLSTGAKIGIGVGAVVVLGVIIYLVTKKK